MTSRVLATTLFLALATGGLQGCSSQTRTELDATAFFQSQCNSCTSAIAQLHEDEVAAQTFTVRYRHSDGTQREAVVLFMRESSAWSVVR
jgi:bacterioferritin-associated ferredoxin